MRELLEVERLARALLSMPVYAEGDCGEECCGEHVCRARQTKSSACSKCGEPVSVDFECTAEQSCEEHCDGVIEVEVDLSNELRDLRLALVQLDMARERARESNTQHDGVTP